MRRSNIQFTGHFEAIPGSEDLLLQLPQEFLQSEDWLANDVLSWEVKPGQIFIANKSKTLREQKGSDTPRA